jgi:hypothetical protein
MTTKYWSREDTQHWISQLENRVEDIDYYLKQTVEWCELYGIYEDKKVFICAMMTVVWVSHMRNEPISKREAFELLGINDWETAPDVEFELGEKYKYYDLEELLYSVSKSFKT